MSKEYLTVIERQVPLEVEVIADWYQPEGIHPNIRAIFVVGINGRLQLQCQLTHAHGLNANVERQQTCQIALEDLACTLFEETLAPRVIELIRISHRRGDSGAS